MLGAGAGAVVAAGVGFVEVVVDGEGDVVSGGAKLEGVVVGMVAATAAAGGEKESVEAAEADAGVDETGVDVVDVVGEVGAVGAVVGVADAGAVGVGVDADAGEDEVANAVEAAEAEVVGAGAGVGVDSHAWGVSTKDNLVPQLAPLESAAATCQAVDGRENSLRRENLSLGGNGTGALSTFWVPLGRGGPLEEGLEGEGRKVRGGAGGVK